MRLVVEHRGLPPRDHLAAPVGELSGDDGVDVGAELGVAQQLYRVPRVIQYFLQVLRAHVLPVLLRCSPGIRPALTLRRARRAREGPPEPQPLVRNDSKDNFYPERSGPSLQPQTACPAPPHSSGQRVKALSAAPAYSSAARQQYQARTLRYGRYGSPSGSSCFGVGVGMPQASP